MDLSKLGGTGFDFLGLDRFVFPEIMGAESTLIQLANPNGQAVRVSLAVWTKDGRLKVFPVQMEIPALGLLSRDLREIFGEIPLEDSDFIHGAATQHVIPMAVIEPEGMDLATVPGLDPATSKTLYVPQYAVGPAGVTEISLVNLNHDCGTATVDLTLFQDSGEPIGEARRFHIPCAQKLHLTDPELFATGQESVSGYVDIRSDVSITGTIRFRGRDGLPYLAVLPMVGATAQELVFGHLASGTISFMGLSVLNPGEEGAQVRLEAFRDSGELLAAQTLPLGPRQRSSRLLGEYFPELANLEVAGGYLRLTSDKPVAAFALFAPWDLSSLMTVPAQK